MKTLQLNQMQKLQGGVTEQEYCATLKMIMDNNEVSESMEFFYQYHNCAYWNR